MSEAPINSISKFSKPLRGRGAEENPLNRFELISLQPDEECDFSEDNPLKTQYFKDTSRSIISYNDSPDIGFEASLNPYRGCEHGCIYCYARPTHEYFGLSSGLDFESKIFTKIDAAKLLRKELMSSRWKPQVLIMSGVTDCYQPIERQLQITRSCLQVLLEFKNPVAIITKNRLITRDIDIFKQMQAYQGCSITISLTTLDSDLAHVMEPRASIPAHRLEAIRQLHEAGIPVGVNLAPMIPGLTDEEIPSLLKAAAQAGAQYAAFVVLRLPYAVKDLFQTWLATHFPDRKEKVLNRIRAMRGGKLYDSTFGKRMHAEGIFAENIEALFKAGCLKSGIPQNWPELSAASFKKPSAQLTLFE